MATCPLPGGLLPLSTRWQVCCETIGLSRDGRLSVTPPQGSLVPPLSGSAWFETRHLVHGWFIAKRYRASGRQGNRVLNVGPTLGGFLFRGVWKHSTHRSRRNAHLLPQHRTVRPRS